MAPHSSTLAGKSHGWRSLVGCSPWGLEKLDTTERLHFHFSPACIGEGNPLQCSCLENPRDRGAWWAAVYGVAQSQTRLKRLSSSNTTVLQSETLMQQQPMFTMGLLLFQTTYKYLTYITSFVFHTMQVGSFHRCGSQGTEKLSNLLKAAWAARGRARL